jgi:hypothetical protein
MQPPEEVNAQVYQAFLQTIGKLAEREIFEFQCEAGAANFMLRLPGLLRKGLAYTEQTALQEVQSLVDSDFVFRRFAWHTPYLIDKLETGQENWRDAVVRLRLMELLLETLSGKPEFEDSWRLLLRQRFCFLAWLTLLVPERQPTAGKQPAENRQAQEGWNELLEYEPRLHQKVRQAQKAWARELIENGDETELLLQRLNREMELEARNLLLGPDETLWTFCRDYPKDCWFSDYILRKWFLPRYDLVTTTKVVRGLLLGWWLTPARAVFDPSGLLPWILTFVGAVVVFISLLLYVRLGEESAVWVRWFVFGGELIGFVPFVGLIGVRSTRAALYPLALRLPAGALVGLVTLTGLVDSLTEFEFVSFNQPWPTRLMIAAALGGAGLYLLAEARSRLADWQLVCRRALGLWAYGWAQAVWLTTAVAWLLTKPAGLMGPTGCKVTARVVPMEWPVQGLCISVDYVVLVSALAFGIGVLLQILWEEKAITEPL